jgi:hypothetical protein
VNEENMAAVNQQYKFHFAQIRLRLRAATGKPFRSWKIAVKKI